MFDGAAGNWARVYEQMPQQLSCRWQAEGAPADWEQAVGRVYEALSETPAAQAPVRSLALVVDDQGERGDGLDDYRVVVPKTSKDSKDAAGAVSAHLLHELTTKQTVLAERQRVAMGGQGSVLA